MAAITPADFIAGIQSDKDTAVTTAAAGPSYDASTYVLRGLSEKHESVPMAPPQPPPEPPDQRQLQLF